MVVKVYHLPNGATVRVHDDYIAPHGSEEERRTIAAQNRAASEILRRAKESRPVS